MVVLSVHSARLSAHDIFSAKAMPFPYRYYTVISFHLYYSVIDIIAYLLKFEHISLSH